MRPVTMVTLLLLAGCNNAGGLHFSSEHPTLDVADAALAAGAPQVALRIATDQLDRHPGKADAMLRKAQAEYALGDLASAHASFNAVLADRPASYEAQLGVSRVELGLNAKAAQLHFQQMAEALPRDVAVLTNLGIAYDLLGQHELAQKMYRQALDIAPDLVSARNNLGLSLALSAQPEQALKVLRPLDATRAQSARMRANLVAVLSGGRGGAAPESFTVAAPPAPPAQPPAPNAGS